MGDTPRKIDWFRETLINNPLLGGGGAPLDCSEQFPLGGQRQPAQPDPAKDPDRLPASPDDEHANPSPVPAETTLSDEILAPLDEQEASEE